MEALALARPRSPAPGTDARNREKKKTAAPAPAILPPVAPASGRPGYPLVDPGIGDPGCQLALATQDSCRVVTSESMCVEQIVGAARSPKRLDDVQRVDDAGAIALAVRFCSLQDLRGIARPAGEEEHQSRLELGLQLIRKGERSTTTPSG